VYPDDVSVQGGCRCGEQRANPRVTIQRAFVEIGLGLLVRRMRRRGRLVSNEDGHAARLRAANEVSHLPIWFQLANFRLTNLPKTLSPRGSHRRPPATPDGSRRTSTCSLTPAGSPAPRRRASSNGCGPPAWGRLSPRAPRVSARRSPCRHSTQKNGDRLRVLIEFSPHPVHG